MLKRGNPTPIEKKEWQEAEGMWEITKEGAEKGDISDVYLWSLLSKYYPENKDKQIRLMGFMAEASRKYREGLPREKAWELARKWDVERMLTTELMEFLPQNNPGNPMMKTVNPTKEEQFATEVAKYLVERRKPEITAKELEAIARELEYENIASLINYIQSAEGRTYFKKVIRLELWQAGYRPRGYEL